MKRNSSLIKTRQRVITHQIRAIIFMSISVVFAAITLITYENNKNNNTNIDQTIACIDNRAKELKLPDNWNNGLTIKAQVDYLGGKCK